MTMNRCMFCDYEGTFDVAVTHEEAVVGDRVFTGEVPAERCPRCGETYTPADGPAAFGEEVARTLIAEGDASGAAFRHLRHTLGLTGQAIAAKLGVAAETVSRWERGERDVDRLAWTAVASLVLDAAEHSERTSKVLAALTREPARLPATVHVAIPRRAG
jgi:YgiT-type zinc finger domain-containing protein